MELDLLRALASYTSFGDFLKEHIVNCSFVSATVGFEYGIAITALAGNEKTWTQGTIGVASGCCTSLSFGYIPCGASPCTVQINSEPRGASIYVNKKLQGSTPHEVKLPDQRAQYELRLKLRGYEEYKTTIGCTRPPSNDITLASLPRIDVRIVFPSDLKYEGCGARVAINWRSGRFYLARMELFPGDEKSYSGYEGEYMTLTHSGYFFCPTDAKPYCLGKNHETEVIFDRGKSYEITFKGQGDDCRTELVER